MIRSVAALCMVLMELAEVPKPFVNVEFGYGSGDVSL